MLRNVSRYWLLILIRGIAAILFGIFALIWSDLAAVALVFMFGFYALIDGLLSVISSVSNRTTNPGWWVTLLEGLAGIVVGFVAFFLPGAAAVALIYLIAAWAIITGIFELVAAVRLREEIQNEWALGLTGVLSVITGIILIVTLPLSITAVVWLIAAYAILFGILMVYLATRIRSVFNDLRAI
jgi:uncharacterized membrane protein HdeD (DUF308 family)